MKNKTKEPQYKNVFEVKKKFGITKLGLMTNQIWNDDPKKLAINLSRYKFVSRILEGFNEVLEVGCGDGFSGRIVKQAVSNLTAIDFDKNFIQDSLKRSNAKWPIRYFTHDILKKPFPKKFDAVYSLDVLEHIKKSKEIMFIKNCKKSLKSYGVMIVGMPSIESQKYASKTSKLGHVNCKSGNELKKILKRHFENVFVFSMNDEVIHTGFYPMAHYLIGLCCGKK